ncbi:hypothetical protein KEM56_005996 [Ascosphaera pollenicola]|nr:hypothetical protein KEM56_005996 [Ascosphaera pollenicola]
MPPQRAPTFPLERSFQQMTLSNTQQQPQQPQPLFPNNTGGFPSQFNNVYHQQASPQPMQTYGQTLQATPTGAGAMGCQTNPSGLPSKRHNSRRWRDAGTSVYPTTIDKHKPLFTTPPAPAQSTPQGYGLGLNGAVAATQPQPLHPMHTGYSAPSVANTTGSPFFTPSPQPQQQQQQQQQQQPMPMQSSPYNPFDAMSGQVQPAMTMSPVPYQIQQQQQPPMQQQQRPQQQYMPQRLNKEGILSLYQFSQAPPTIYENQAQNHTQQQQALPQNGQPQSSVGAPVPLMQPPRRSATMPMLGASSVNGEAQAPSIQTPAFTSSNGLNPQYHGAAVGPAAAPTMHPGVRTHMSQESLDMSAWQSGRQSPDAFANLSARYR